MTTHPEAPETSADDLWFTRPEARRWRGPQTSGSARGCHRMLPGYARTPLVPAPDLATAWSVGHVFVKDESSRFGLPSFKALGVSYAIVRLLADRAGEAVSTSWTELQEQARAHPVTLVTATDGNHGRALAHFATLLGLGTQIIVPDVMTQAAADAIAAEGAVVTRIDGSYDEAVAAAAAVADASADKVLVQDTAWPGYEVVPGWIVEGYQTMLEEVSEQLADLGLGEPALVAVPVGVGSLAQAVVAYYRAGDRQRPTSVLSCEPDTAACILASLRAGELTRVPTGSTNMAGLNCGTPTSLGWPVLRDGLDAAVAVTDAAAAEGVRELTALGLSAGASGAATVAGVAAALSGEGANGRRQDLGLTDESVLVLLSTEGSAGAGGLT